MNHTSFAIASAAALMFVAACGPQGSTDTLSAAELDTVQLALDGTVDGAAGGGVVAPPGRHVPAEALAACAGKAAADVCTFNHRERTLTGACQARPDDAAALVCRPNPPAELVAACATLAEGAACSFTTPEGEARTGLCHAPRFDAAPLLCAPERHHGGCHHGGDGGADDHHRGDGGADAHHGGEGPGHR